MRPRHHVRRRGRQGAARLGRGGHPRRAARVHRRRASRTRPSARRASASARRMQNSGYEFPLRRITVNLAPAYLRKVGPAFDLPLAVALLVASGQLEPEAIESCAIVGELSLTGEMRPVRGALAVAEARPRPRPEPADPAALACARGVADPGHRGHRHRVAGRARGDAARRRRTAGHPAGARRAWRRRSPTSRTSAATTRSCPGSRSRRRAGTTSSCRARRARARR